MDALKQGLGVALFLLAALALIYTYYGKRWSLPKADWMLSKIGGSEKPAVVMISVVYILIYLANQIGGYFGVL